MIKAQHHSSGSDTDIRSRIESTFAQQTPTGKRIASFVLNNLEQLPFETANSIAERTGTSGISVGRYLRGLGYRNLDDLKQALRQQAGSIEQQWMVTDRLQTYRHQSPPECDALQLEVDAIEYVHRLSQRPEFRQVAKRIASAEAVFILGVQSTRGIAQAFFSHLEYLRPRVFYADGQSGTYVESLNSEFNDPYIVLTDTRAYSKMAQTYCRAATERRLPMALITDVYCPWAHDYPLDLLQVKTATGQFWDSLAPLTYLFNLLLSAVVKQGGEAVAQRLHENRQLQKALGQFES